MDSGAHDSPLVDVQRPSAEERLDSWKEIATYLKRSARTVRRWEAEENLPVHRHVHRNGGSVYAFKGELDLWLASRTSTLSESAPVEPFVAGEPAPPALSSSYRFTVRRVTIAGVLVILALALAGLWRLRSAAAASAPAIASLAVLPLENLTGDPSQTYIADGLTDALITELARMSDVHVISRTSVNQYKDATQKRLPEIARQLNVDAVVAGAVVLSGSHVRITAQLIDARTDRHLWARGYNRELTDLAELLQDVAQEIGGAVAGTLTTRSDSRRRQVDPDAYRLFFQSLVAGAQGQEGYPTAIAYLRQAIDKDPSFAPAYSRMSLYLLQSSFPGNVAPKQFMPQAEAAARRAIELDDTLDEGHAVLGIVLHRFRWEWSASENEFRRALRLNKDSAETHRRFSELLAETGRSEEAIAEARRARELDPRSQSAALELAKAYRAAGQYDAALDEIRVALRQKPVARAHVLLGNVYVDKGMPRDATAEFETAVLMTHRSIPMYLSTLAYMYARSGQPRKARTILDELKTLATRQYVPSTSIARVYLGLDNKQAARPWIEKAYQERDLDLVSLKADIGLSALRSDPDFRDVFSRVGLHH